MGSEERFAFEQLLDVYLQVSVDVPEADADDRQVVGYIGGSVDFEGGVATQTLRQGDQDADGPIRREGYVVVEVVLVVGLEQHMLSC